MSIPCNLSTTSPTKSGKASGANAGLLSGRTDVGSGTGSTALLRPSAKKVPKMSKNKDRQPDDRQLPLPFEEGWVAQPLEDEPNAEIVLDGGRCNIPEAWELSHGEAVDFWGSHTLALLMEAQHDDPISKQLLQFYGLNAPSCVDHAYVATWGLPDVRAAREFVGFDFETFAIYANLPEDTLALIEYGWVILDIEALLNLAREMSWPLGIFFRDEKPEWHQMTRLSRERRVRGGGK
jgi:hypothetical protein